MSGSESGLVPAKRESMPLILALHHQHNQAPPQQQQHNQAPPPPPPPQQHNQTPPKRESMPLILALHQQHNQTPPQQQHNQAPPPPPQQHNQTPPKRESMSLILALHHQHNQAQPPQQQHMQAPPPQQQHMQAPQQRHRQAPPPQQRRQAPPHLKQYQNMQLSIKGGADGTAVYKPVRLSPPPPPPGYSAGGGNPALNMNMPVTMTGSEPVKKRRGRPRKYGPGSGGMPMALVTGSPSFTVGQSSGSGGGTSPTAKKRRGGRPPGPSKRDKPEALGSTGVGLIPHVLTVRTGEDVSSMIMGFSRNGPGAVSVLSANGLISTATLCQPDTPGGTVTYEGIFEILCLSGILIPLENNNGHTSRTGGLRVSLSAPDNKVFGGRVSGLLIAASPIQIVLGSFIPDGQNEQTQHGGLLPPPLPRVAPTQPLMTPSSPKSRGTMSESSSKGHGSPLHQSTRGPYNTTNTDNTNTTTTTNTTNNTTNTTNNNANLSMPWE